MPAPAAARAGGAACTRCAVHAESVFRVEGMDCGEEVLLLERRLRPLAGLEDLSADIVGQTLRVTYDAALLSAARIAEAVADTGMRAWLAHEQPVAVATTRTRGGLAGAAAMLLVAGGAARTLGAPSPWADAAFLLATGLAGVHPAQRAVASVRRRVLDMHVLMACAVAGAVALGDYAEAATVVLLFSLAQWLEARTMDRAREAIRALLDLAPPEARVRHGAHEHAVPIEQVEPGAVLVVRPGEKLALDGVVVSGTSEVNQAPITGESLPVTRQPGDEVFAGSINGHGALEVRVTRRVRDTTLARIIHLVESAQAQRAPVQQFVDRFAQRYTPAVLAASALVALAPLVTTGGWALWGYRALVLLVVACPCALVISTPVSMVAALAGAARRGVLIKGGAHLERLAAVRAVAFDKTGTLTHGTLAVADVVPLGAWTRDALLQTAAAVEARSEHPVARAVVDAARDAGLAVVPAADVVARPGIGVEGRVAGRHVAAGSVRAAEACVEGGAALTAALAAQAAHGRTAVAVTVDGAAAGVIGVADRARAVAADAVVLLRGQGVVHVAMLTGDTPEAAAPVARAAGLDAVHAALLPADKVRMIAALRAAHGTVAMVGDGINDAPALAAADVGIVMGAIGSDVAIETADVALMTDELQKVPYAVRLSRAAMRNVRANVAISIGLKAAFLVMAVTGTATLWMAVLADTGASMIVVANALRLLRAR